MWHTSTGKDRSDRSLIIILHGLTCRCSMSVLQASKKTRSQKSPWPPPRPKSLGLLPSSRILAEATAARLQRGVTLGQDHRLDLHTRTRTHHRATDPIMSGGSCSHHQLLFTRSFLFSERTRASDPWLHSHSHVTAPSETVLAPGIPAATSARALILIRHRRRPPHQDYYH